MIKSLRVTDPGKVKHVGRHGLGEAPEMASLDAKVALIPS